VFAILHRFRYLEASGSSLLFGSIWKLTVIWKHVEAHCYLEACESSLLFGSMWKLTAIWKHVEAHCYLEACGSSLLFVFCTVLSLKRQNGENRELPDASKTVNTVSWSQTLCSYIKRLTF
jgi:hypothetical protein